MPGPIWQNPAWAPVTSTPSQSPNAIPNLPTTTTNQFLVPVAVAEDAAEAATIAAHSLGAAAMTANTGYDPAQGAVKAAVKAWRAVDKLAIAIEDAPAAQATPEATADMAAAKIAAPGIRGTVHGALADLGQLHQALLADQAEKRPDLPPAKQIDPYADESSVFWPLAIAGGIGYLLWKAVF